MILSYSGSRYPGKSKSLMILLFPKPHRLSQTSTDISAMPPQFHKYIEAQLMDSQLSGTYGQGWSQLRSGNGVGTLVQHSVQANKSCQKIYSLYLKPTNLLTNNQEVTVLSSYSGAFSSVSFSKEPKRGLKGAHM